MKIIVRISLLAILFLTLVDNACTQLLFEENFEYTATTQLVANGWTQTGATTTNPILVSSAGLSYANYAGAGVGNAANLGTSGQDVNKAFITSVTSGSVYATFMVSVGSAQSSDYFFHLIQAPATSNVFAAKVFVRQSNNGNLAFGVSKRSNTPSLSDSVYSLNTSYLIVVKYTFNSGTTTDDQVCLYVFSEPMFPTTEPAVPTVGPVTDAVPDATSLDLVGLRQGSPSNAPTVTIDGIKISTNWEAPLPITLASFRCTAVTPHGVKLDWSTISEINNYGFEVQRSATPDAGYQAVSELISGHGTTNVEQHYSFTDASVSSGTWFYRLKQIDLDKTEHFGEAIKVENGPAQAALTQFRLDQNCPNPFNPTTTIQYALPKESRVSLKIYSVLGQEVATLVDEVQSASYYQMVWDGKDRNGSQVATGIYLYRIEAAPVENGGSPFVMVRKMLLEK